MSVKFIFFSFVVLSSVFQSKNNRISDSIKNVRDTSPPYIKQIEIKLKLADQIYNADIKKALFYSRQALNEAEKLNNRRWIAESKLCIGKCYEYLGVNTEALNHLKDALEIFTGLKDEYKRVIALKQIAYIYYYSGEYPVANKYFNEVYKYGKIANDTLILVAGIIGRGQVYGNTNRFDSAMILFNESFKLSKKVEDTPTEVQSLFYIGDVYLFTNRYREALKIYHKIDNEYNLEKVNSKLLAALYNSMTKAYIQINNIELAKLYSKIAFETLKKYPRFNHQMYYYQYKFRIDTMEKNYPAAIESLLKFKQFNDSINNQKFAENRNNFEIVYNLEKKEAEIYRLKLDNQIKDASIKNRKIVNYGSIVLVTLLLVILFQGYRSFTKIRKQNRILERQKAELSNAYHEISIKSSDLSEKNSELETLLEELNNAQNQLIQAEKMASLGLLAAGVAHEINNPLNFVQGGITAIEYYFQQNLRDHLLEISPLIDGMQNGVDRAAAIITSLNQYSRQDKQLREACNIHSIIDNCLVILQNQIKDKIIVVRNYTNIEHKLICNESKMHQVFINILVNAIHAIENKGTITIHTIIAGLEMIIKIQDNGCGIRGEDLPKIFDPFFTTKEPGKGTGLGLSITYNILKEHGGKIQFNSSLDKGTEVEICLPLHE